MIALGMYLDGLLRMQLIWSSFKTLSIFLDDQLFCKTVFFSNDNDKDKTNVRESILYILVFDVWFAVHPLLLFRNLE